MLHRGDWVAFADNFEVGRVEALDGEYVDVFSHYFCLSGDFIGRWHRSGVTPSRSPRGGFLVTEIDREWLGAIRRADRDDPVLSGDELRTLPRDAAADEVREPRRGRRGRRQLGA